MWRALTNSLAVAPVGARIRGRGADQVTRCKRAAAHTAAPVEAARPLAPRSIWAASHPWQHASSLDCCRAFCGAAKRGNSDWDRLPRSSDNPLRKKAKVYTEEDINLWRQEFGFAKMQHSMADLGYTDDELLEWRKPFDELSKPGDVIEYPNFYRFVHSKYAAFLTEERLKEKVDRYWDQFDSDTNGVIDFGEFIDAGLLFDVEWAKDKIREEGIEEVFAKYAEHDFICEPQVFELMCDFHFFVATATDVRKLVSAADLDHDGLVDLREFKWWVNDADNSWAHGCGGKKPKGKQKGIPKPPPEPDMDLD